MHLLEPRHLSYAGRALKGYKRNFANICLKVDFVTV